MFNELIVNYKGVITFKWKEVNKIHEDVSPLIVIKIIEYKAW
jgi:hypothetical protein